MVDCELFYYKWLKSEGFDVGKVKIITPLIFLNIASLHHYPYSHLLYFFGEENALRAAIKIIFNKLNYIFNMIYCCQS